MSLHRRVEALEHAPSAAVHPGIAEARRRAADLLAQPGEPESPEEREAEQRAGRLLALLLDHVRKG